MFYFCVGRDSKGLSQLDPQTQEAMQVRMYRLLASLINAFPCPNLHFLQPSICTTQLGVNTSVMHPAATQHVLSTGLRPKLSVSFLHCRVSRLKLLEYQYYSTLDKMAALEPLTLQHLTVSTSASFSYHCTCLILISPCTCLVSVQYRVTVTKYLAYIPAIVICPPTHTLHPLITCPHHKGVCHQAQEAVVCGVTCPRKHDCPGQAVSM